MLVKHGAVVVLFLAGLWPGVREPRAGQDAWQCGSGKGCAMCGREDPRYGDKGRNKGVAHQFFLMESFCREENERFQRDRHGDKFRQGMCICNCRLRGSVHGLEHSDYAFLGESIPPKGGGTWEPEYKIPTVTI